MNHYRTSNGERVSKAKVDRLVRLAKARALEAQELVYGYNFCTDCGRNASGTRLDCSHEISVDECQKSGRTELAWDIDNIKIRCRTCHQIHDKNHISKVKKNDIEECCNQER